MSRLTDEEVAAGLEGSGWAREGDAITREWELADFAAAIALVDDVAELAEAAGHHPDILVHGFNRLRLTLSTHSEGGLTQADLDLARAIDAAA
jgi:4a-hydroxytetrahydrobiopterin dehydratase